MIGRIPILDVQPVVQCGRYPAKAVPGESCEVTATVFREGHEMLGAGVVLRDPAAARTRPSLMRELAEGSDRYGAEVAAASEGMWQFRVEAWGDPIARWRHDAAIKVPIGQDVELMLGRGRAAAAPGRGRHPRRLPPPGPPRSTPPAPPGSSSATWPGSSPAASSRPGPARAAAAPQLAELLRRYPLRDLLTRSAWHPLIVHRAARPVRLLV